MPSLKHVIPTLYLNTTLNFGALMPKRSGMRGRKESLESMRKSFTST